MGRSNNGRVHPSPSSSSSNSDYLSVLKLLPQAILALTSTLTADDQELLAYMIKSPSRDSSSPASSSSLPQDSKKKAAASSKKTHSPAFTCDCFDCYTSYWSRWDSSVNKDLIHHIIEDYESNDTHHSAKKSKKSGRSRRRSNSKMGPSKNPPTEVSGPQSSEPSPSIPEAAVIAEEPSDVPRSESTPEDVVTDEASNLLAANLTAMEDCLGAAADSHRGLGRKVFPDVMGLFNSRIWSFWSPKF